ncbi:MAG: hypothetical protein HQ588_02605 [Deltaproteobacteria bacterium]|nr:hypothetical protein [Deltaproteobacteria bacterium]
MTAERELEKGISEIVGAICDPIIVMPGGWGDTLPDWLKSAITLERLIENMKVIKGEEMTGTDAEACAYLYTAGLTAPFDHDWAQIYLYITTKVYEKQRTPQSGATMPEDIRVESLTRNQEDDLNRLKRWLYERRVKARQERDRDEKRQERVEKAARDKLVQPELFTLPTEGGGKG